jgi:hypothetical protein
VVISPGSGHDQKSTLAEFNMTVNTWQASTANKIAARWSSFYGHSFSFTSDKSHYVSLAIDSRQSPLGSSKPDV